MERNIEMYLIVMKSIISKLALISSGGGANFALGYHKLVTKYKKVTGNKLVAHQEHQEWRQHQHQSL